MDPYDFISRSIADSLIPVRPGHVNGQPFWNHYASRFMIVPSFDYLPVEGAVKYVYTVTDRMHRYDTPVDASNAKMIHFYLDMYDVEHDPTDLACHRAALKFL